MPGPLPTSDRPRPSGLGWVDVPNVPRPGPAPELPAGDWPDATREAWAELWRLPVAAMWDQSGATLHGWAEVRRIIDQGGASAAMWAELRQLEDRHGVSPRAALQCRYRLVEPEELRRPAAAPARAGKRRDPRLAPGAAGSSAFRVVGRDQRGA